jgi:HSP20 family protein
MVQELIFYNQKLFINKIKEIKTMLPNTRRRAGFPYDWDNFFGNDLMRSAAGETRKSTVPAVNIMEEEDKFMLEFATPGMKKKDFKIELHNDVLTVSSDRKEEKEEEKDNYSRREFHYQSFCRSFSLPESADTEKIEAKQENGVLNIIIPKKEESLEKGPRSIDIS